MVTHGRNRSLPKDSMSPCPASSILSKNIAGKLMTDLPITRKPVGSGMHRALAGPAASSLLDSGFRLLSLNSCNSSNSLNSFFRLDRHTWRFGAGRR